jgi:hypothetical protein
MEWVRYRQTSTMGMHRIGVGTGVGTTVGSGRDGKGGADRDGTGCGVADRDGLASGGKTEGPTAEVGRTTMMRGVGSMTTMRGVGGGVGENTSLTGGGSTTQVKTSNVLVLSNSGTTARAPTVASKPTMCVMAHQSAGWPPR